MATVYLAGDATGVAGVYTFELTAYDATTTYKATINGKTVSVLGSGGTVTTAAAAFVVALNASTIPEFAEVTWTSNAGFVIGTVDAQSSVHYGRPLTLTASVSGGTGTVGAVSTTTAPDGSRALTANNCKDTTGARTLPANSDTFVISNLESDLFWGLDALAARTGLIVDIRASFEGDIYLPFTNENAGTTAANTYNEYRQRYLQTTGGTFYIGDGEGDGSSRIMLDAGNAVATFIVYGSDNAEDDGNHAIILKGTNASNTLSAYGGSVEIAPFAGEVSTLLTLTASDDAVVRTGTGVTLGTVHALGQSVITINSAAALTDITAVNVRGNAAVYLYGDNPATTITLNGERPTLHVLISAACTTTALNLYEGATLDLDNSLGSLTVTTLTVYGECTINDRAGKLLVTNAVGNFSQLTYNGPPGRQFTFGTP